LRTSISTGAARSSRRGAVLAQVVVALTLILGVAALVLDGGLLLDRSRSAQAGADASALAAAEDLFVNYPTNGGSDPNGSAAARALTVAAANGWPNDGTTSIVTVNIPPKSGAFTDPKKYPGYVEVIFQWNEASNFSAIWGGQSVPVRARSVARGQWAPADPAFLMLNLHAAQALTLSGGASISSSGGSVVVNSDSGAAAVLTGGAAVSVAAPGKVYVTGGWSGLAGLLPVSASPLPDPLRFIPPVDPITLPVRTWPSNGGTIYPGRYIGSCQVSGSAIIMLAGEGVPDPNAGNAPIRPGQAIYYFDGGQLSSSGGSGFVSNGGVLICLAPSGSGNGLNISGSGTLNITPQTAGPYAGMSFFQARGSSAPVALSGSANASSKWSGTFYAPSAPVTISGSGVLGTAQIVCDTLTLSGQASASADYLAPKAKIRHLQLVE
jgi:hypothetical protein